MSIGALVFDRPGRTPVWCSSVRYLFTGCCGSQCTFL